ncbi:MAG: hypothetical protein J5486_05215 [Bacteroidaceae bacterium]|nr:hypothetical protein [Bacteroidaceae bacterium]
MRNLLSLAIIVLAFISCHDENRYDISLDGIEELKNDYAFVVGKWQLTRLEPTFNSSSWIEMKKDCTFTSYFMYPAAPYADHPSGTYTYSNGVIRCKDNDGLTERMLIFTQITGSSSYNKIKYIYPIDESGAVDTLDFTLCKKQ